MRPIGGLRGQRASTARRIMVFAGLVLASSFVMPAVPACNSPIIPAQELASGLRDFPGRFM